jgi:putative PIN family toxin of toxin-antitoxin system
LNLRPSGADVLAFIRFLKISLPNEEKISKDFKEALQDARATAEANNITQADIDAEIRAVRDGKDDKFLEAAVSGKVDFIVSGDSHLLAIKEFRSIPIITGREFLDWLKNA